MVESLIEFIGKKLVDILGNKALRLSNKDKTRAASYKMFYSLKRIEETFGKIAHYLHIFIEKEYQKGNAIRDDMTYVARLLYPELNFLTDQLDILKKSFKEMGGKFEIYGNFQDALFLEKLTFQEDLLLQQLGVLKQPENMKDLTLNMVDAVNQARQSIASFIKENYGINEREDGR